jgi:ArsR family transcriptional regulator, arsenate/arsenite/antimonite-responsive transcriptional repressor
MRRGNSPHTIATINFGSTQAVKTKKVGRPSRDSKFKEAARVYKFLSDPFRLKVVQYLMEHGETSLSELVDAISDLSVPASNHHIKWLLLGGIIKKRNEGRYCYYSVNAEIVSKYLPDDLFT